jgi:hypothetical protein
MAVRIRKPTVDLQARMPHKRLVSVEPMNLYNDSFCGVGSAGSGESDDHILVDVARPDRL